jgi:hypothetical protein
MIAHTSLHTSVDLVRPFLPGGGDLVTEKLAESSVPFQDRPIK